MSDLLNQDFTYFRISLGRKKRNLIIDLSIIIEAKNYIVGEPKSRIVQKHTFFAPERYTAGILYTDSLDSD